MREALKLVGVHHASDVGSKMRKNSMYSESSKIQIFLVMAMVLIASRLTGAGENDGSVIDAFRLDYWNSDNVFQLDEWKGGIVILDFFAYWCAPCRVVSSDLEQEVNAYYKARRGNRYGIPVNVVSVNVEQQNPEKTDAFIKRVGAATVLTDPDGKLLNQFRGKSLPFIVVLDGSDANEGWRVIYQKSGYEGSGKIRAIVDATSPDGRGPNPANVVVDPSHSIENEQVVDKKAGPIEGSIEPTSTVATVEDDVEGRVAAELDMPLPMATGDSFYDLQSDALISSDISLLATRFLRRGVGNAAETEVVLSYRRFDIEYQPFSEADVVGDASRRLESNVSLRSSLNSYASQSLQYKLSAGAYLGFTDHRSIWLDEYYRQQFSAIDGYEKADPWGMDVSAGLTWDTLSSYGILGASLGFQQDDVAPGYDRPLFQPLERGRERLYTASLALTMETVASPWIRILHELRFAKTTDREVRYGYRGFVNLALSENLVARFEGAYTFEETALEGESDFRSYSTGLTFEYDWDQRWFLGVSGRLYDDNGQIETSILVSNGPPPLETRHLGLSLRRQEERNSWKLSLASYESRFEKVDTNIRPFGNLYKSRDWLLVDFSFAHWF